MKRCAKPSTRLMRYAIPACVKLRNFSHSRRGDETFLERRYLKRDRHALERTNGEVPRPGRGNGAAIGETSWGVAARTGEVAGILGTNAARRGASAPRALEGGVGARDLGVRGSHRSHRSSPLRTHAGKYPSRDAG